MREHVLDTTKMVAAAFLGLTVTESDVDMFLRFSIGGATAIYMVGKACLIWIQVGKARHGKEIKTEGE